MTYTATNNELCFSVVNTDHRRGVRGRVSDFSPGARGRLLRFINSAVFDTALFVTLTYHDVMTDAKATYRDLRLWYKNMVYQWGGACVVWRAELQERGCIHYHLFVLNAAGGWNKQNMVSAWLSVCGTGDDWAHELYGVDVKDAGVLGSSDMGVMVSYLAKYVTKDGTSVKGKQWGILGRRMAKEVRSSAAVDADRGYALWSALVALGAKVSPVDGGGVVVRLYCGGVGVSGASRDSFDKVAEEVARICGSIGAGAKSSTNL